MKLSRIETSIDKDKINSILEKIDECGDEMLKMEISEIMLDGHLCEESAVHKIGEMEPVVLMKDGSRWSSQDKHIMCAYMNAIGIGPLKAHEHVLRAYEVAKQKGSTMGIQAPHLSDKLTVWDCWWCMAMIFSDYWVTTDSNPEKVAMMAYEYLSDPDKH